MTTDQAALKLARNNAIDDIGLDAMIGKAHVGIARAMKSIRRPEARVGIVPSPLGKLMIAESERGLAMIHYLFISDAERPLALLRKRFDLVENRASTDKVGAEIKRYFDGDTSVMSRRVDLSVVESEFQRRALTALQRVPAGSVITYQGLAAAVGKPDSQRAIGNTMASNPIPILVPCHRVVKSDGTIGNYGGGVENKIKLLRAEGFKVGPDRKLPEEAVLGHSQTHIFCRPQCSAAKRANPVRMLIFANPACAEHAGLRPCKLCRPA
jgi:O-6-methylguanine DNA methyltransferase